MQACLATCNERCPWQPICQWPCQCRPSRDAENDRTDSGYVNVPSVLTTQSVRAVHLRNRRSMVRILSGSALPEIALEQSFRAPRRGESGSVRDRWCRRRLRARHSGCGTSLPTATLVGDRNALVGGVVHDHRGPLVGVRHDVISSSVPNGRIVGRRCGRHGRGPRVSRGLGDTVGVMRFYPTSLGVDTTQDTCGGNVWRRGVLTVRRYVGLNAAWPGLNCSSGSDDWQVNRHRGWDRYNAADR